MTARLVRPAAVTETCDGWRCGRDAVYEVTVPADPDCPPRRRCPEHLANAADYLLLGLADAGLKPAVTVTAVTNGS